jgi:S-adenosylmethionine decarboxylase
MNGMEEAAFSTIHITPEQGQSYASVELSGYSPGSIDRDAVISKVTTPPSLSMCVWVGISLFVWRHALHIMGDLTRV